MATNTCPRCKLTFRVLADESGEHECPRCHWTPEEAQDEEEMDAQDEANKETDDGD